LDKVYIKLILFLTHKNVSIINFIKINSTLGRIANVTRFD